MRPPLGAQEYELKVESDARIAGVREEESKRRNSAAALRAWLPLVVAAPCKLRMDLIALRGCPLRGCPPRLPCHLGPGWPFPGEPAT